MSNSDDIKKRYPVYVADDTPYGCTLKDSEGYIVAAGELDRDDARYIEECTRLRQMYELWRSGMPQAYKNGLPDHNLLVATIIEMLDSAMKGEL